VGDWREMLPDFGQPLSDAQEIQRPQLLLDGADKQLRKVETDREKSQLEGAQGRVNFIDKLTIGAGAAIAALVSFLGSHSAGLHPRWILNSALTCLAFTMLAGLIRNYRYPNYVMQIHKISWIRCSIYQQQCRLNCIRADPNTVSIQTGKPINIEKTIKDFTESEAQARAALTEQEKIGEHLLKQWTYAENLCLTFVFLSMVSLICLAIFNF
jgi:hypothetical protein